VLAELVLESNDQNAFGFEAERLLLIFLGRAQLFRLSIGAAQVIAAPTPPLACPA